MPPPRSRTAIARRALHTSSVAGGPTNGKHLVASRVDTRDAALCVPNRASIGIGVRVPRRARGPVGLEVARERPGRRARPRCENGDGDRRAGERQQPSTRHHADASGARAASRSGAIAP